MANYKKSISPSKSKIVAERREISEKKQQKKSQAMVKHRKNHLKNDNGVNFEPENDMIFGKISVLELLNGKRDVNKLFCQEGLNREKISEILSLSKSKGIHVQFVPKARLDSLTNDGVHQGVVAFAATYQYATLDDLFQMADKRQEPPFFVILDGIEDPHNLGAIMRSVDAVGAHGIIIPKHRATGLTATVAKAAAGAIEHVPVVRVTNLTQTIEQLKARGVWVYATDMTGERYTDWQASGAVAIVIGNEGKGVSRLVKQEADGLITIPMQGHVQSLNASVAAGVLLFEVRRQRQQ